MKFQKQAGRVFRFNGIDGVAYTSALDYSSGDVAIAEVNGRHGRSRNMLSDRFYLVIEGTGRFMVNDKDIPVAADDVIFVAKNTPYDFEGIMRVAIFGAPAFDPATEVDMEATP